MRLNLIIDYASLGDCKLKLLPLKSYSSIFEPYFGFLAELCVKSGIDGLFSEAEA